MRRVLALAWFLSIGGAALAAEKPLLKLRAVPFTDVKGTKKNDKWYLTMNTTKDDMKNALGLTYDRSTTKWVPEKK